MPRSWNLTMRLFAVLALAAIGFPAHAQIDEDEIGAWYMYLWSARSEDRVRGWQGDVQYRNWDTAWDLEQLLIRAAATWSPRGGRNTYAAGYAHIATGAFGSGTATVSENRLYQEASLPQRIGTRIYMTHRFRFEQRWIQHQDFRTRLRYFIAMNYPFNRTDLGPGAVYLSLYNELFINGERDIGDGRKVDRFDRNRLYAAIGYSATDSLRVQFGYMYQSTSSFDKGQLQLTFVHAF